MSTEVLRIESPADFTAALQQAAELLRAGEVVAVPTETVYGLAANALDASAVQKIYDIKGRPATNPIIVHVASLQMARDCSSAWPQHASLLAAEFWPGPLTLVVPKAPCIPSIVTAGGATVGLRWPSHPFMQELIRTCGFPIAAPSANRANELSPTTAEHVLQRLRVPLVVDGGACNVGIESTVVDLSGEPRLLRAGMISAAQIERVLQHLVTLGPEEDAILKSPGLLKKHYAPRAPLHVTTWRDETQLRQIIVQLGTSPERTCVIAHERIPQSAAFLRVAVIPHDAEAYARALYAELHRCDQAGARLILVEELPSGAEWEGIRDRLKRGSATH